MQEVMDWIDKEVERLDSIIEGKETESNGQIPVLLKAALTDCG